MLIRWFGHASFLLQAADGTKVITDPYESGAYNGGIMHRSIDVEPDVVTVSHDHADHGYVEGVPGKFQTIVSSGSWNVKGVNISGIDCFHDLERGGVRGPNVMFAITIDEVRVAHLGDLGHELDSCEIEQLGTVDVLLIPVGGYYTIGPEQATRVVEKLNPKLVIPMHFKNEKINLTIGPVDDFLCGKQNVKMPDTSEIEVTKETLPAATEIVVLKPVL
jgi:L-ascorbate metabolism protein UlaG (beta-lactamase superfamily)